MTSNTQYAPYPAELAALVGELTYREGWRFHLEVIDRDRDSEGKVVGRGLTLIVNIECLDSYTGMPKRVYHYFPVIPATYDARSWQRWLFECILLVERHEAMEFFTLAGVKPYAPSHGPGNDPYLIRELGTDLDRRTAYTGEVNQ
jgi:hypothetical protein